MFRNSQDALSLNIINNEEILQIEYIPQTPKSNQIMMKIFFVWFVVYTFYKSFTDPNIGGTNLSVVVFISIMLIGLISGYFGLKLGQKINKSQIRKILINKKDKTLKSEQDGIAVSASEIVKISIIEKIVLFRSHSLLKLHLKNGEKTLMLPFSSYDQASKALGHMNVALGLK